MQQPLKPAPVAPQETTVTPIAQVLAKAVVAALLAQAEQAVLMEELS